MKRIAVVLTLALVLLCIPYTALAATPSPITPAAGYDSVLLLDNKTNTVTPAIAGTWQLTPLDNTYGVLSFKSSAATFQFSFTASGLAPGTNYSLIYYADKPDRFVAWGGNNPGALIATFNSDGSGNIAPTTGDVNLNKNLPSAPDANISEFNYSDPPDNYTTAHGAKIWLVPSSCYTAGSDLKVTTWTPDSFLFETKLITYQDTDVSGSQIGLTVNVLPDLIQISVAPTTIDFGQLYAGSQSADKPVTITNTGSVTVKVTATTSGSDFYATCLQINGGAVSAWNTTIAKTENAIANLHVIVPNPYPAGVTTGTIVFWAEKP